MKRIILLALTTVAIALTSVSVSAAVSTSQALANYKKALEEFENKTNSVFEDQQFDESQYAVLFLNNDDIPDLFVVGTNQTAQNLRMHFYLDGERVIGLDTRHGFPDYYNYLERSYHYIEREGFVKEYIISEDTGGIEYADDIFKVTDPKCEFIRRQWKSYENDSETDEYGYSYSDGDADRSPDLSLEMYEAEIAKYVNMNDMKPITLVDNTAANRQKSFGGSATPSNPSNPKNPSNPSNPSTSATSSKATTIKASANQVKKGKKSTVTIKADSGAVVTVTGKNALAKNKNFVKIGKASKAVKLSFTKKAKKGAYKFTVSCPASGNYKAVSKKVITIKVK